MESSKVGVIECEICGKKDLKSKAGLMGHKKISHGVDVRKTVPDDIGMRLERLEKHQGNVIKLLEKITDFIELSSNRVKR